MKTQYMHKFGIHAFVLNCKLPIFVPVNINAILLLYFFGYKTEFFSFQNNAKNLDPSYKMDLDLWNCF